MTLIDQAIAQTGGHHVYAMLSGGTDSAAVLTQAIQHPNFRGALHVNTGVGIEDTREYVRELCQDISCPLFERCATRVTKANGTPDPQIYEQLVLEHGFPGPTKFGHGKMYNRLKERALEGFLREIDASSRQPAVLVTGVRSEESTRRMGFVEPIQHGVLTKGGWRQRNRVWVAAIGDWTKRQCLDAIKNQGWPINPITKLIHKSGECYCGGFAQPNELEELTIWRETRKFAYWMLDLQKRVMEKFPWRWDQAVPKWYLQQKRGQQMLFDMAPGPMCHGCSHEEEA